jgi:hypothetical protein
MFIQMLEFFTSLGVFGYILLAIIAVCLINIKKIVLLRSPLDSEQHKIWRSTGGVSRPDHLDDTPSE